MRLFKPFSVLQIFSALVTTSSLLILSALMINSYLLGSKAYDEALSQSFSQKAYIAQQMINSNISHIEQTLSFWAKHPSIIDAIDKKNEKEVKKLIEVLIPDSQALALDLIYVTDLNKKLLIDSSSAFYLSKLIFKMMITSDEENDSFLFQEEDGPHLIYFQRINIVNPHTKELMAYFYGGVVFNHWLDFIHQMAEGTRSADLILYANHHTILSTAGKSLENIPAISHEENQRRQIYKTGNTAFQIAPVSLGRSVKTELLLTDDLSRYSYLQKRYLYSSFVWLFIIAVVSFLTIVIINKVFKTSLTQLLEMLQAYARKQEAKSFTPTSIREFNTIGRTVEEMVRTIKQSERIFHTIFDHSTQLMGLLAPDGTVVDINKTALDMVNSKIDDVRGKKFWNTPWWSHSPTLQVQLREAIEKMKDEHVIRFEAIHYNEKNEERTISASLRPVMDENGKIILIIPEGLDISETKQAQKLLMRHNQELENEVSSRTNDLSHSLERIRETHRQVAKVTMAVDASNEAIAVISEQGEINYYNRSFARFFELEKKEIKSIFEIFPERAHIQGRMTSLINGVEWVEKISIRLPSHKQIDLLLNANMVNPENEKNKTIIMTFTDLTKLVETEEKLQQSEMEKYIAINSNRAKSAFLANMSHKLRTPLHCITSFTGLAHKKVKQNELLKVSSYLDTVSECTGELSELIDQLLLLSSLEAGLIHYTKRQYSIDVLMEDIQKHFKGKLEAKNLSLNYHSNNPSIKANFDSHHMIQVFNCLLSNAIKYATANSSIEIVVDDYSENGVLYTIVSFKNMGLAIPQSELELIFNSNTISTNDSKTGTGGMGIGLSICRKIIEDHEGRIWASSSVEGLTEICMILPKYIDE